MGVINFGEIKEATAYEKAVKVFRQQGFSATLADVAYWNGDHCYLPDFAFYDEVSGANWAPAYSENEGYTLVMVN